MNIIGGYVGIFIGLLAMYSGMEEIINEIYGNKVLTT